MRLALKTIAVASLAMSLSAAYAQKGETVKIALIDPQTGLMGPLGQNQMRSWQFLPTSSAKTTPPG